MEDKAFLLQAFRSSFAKPLIDSADGVVYDAPKEDRNNHIFVDTYQSGLLPFTLSGTQVKKYQSLLKSDIADCPALFGEYGMYKHDLSENITIPENIPEIAAAKKQLDLLIVNRQSAQKKKIAATIIPAKFALKLKTVRQDYFAVRQRIEQILAADPKAVNLSILDDFQVMYLKFLQKFKWWHPLLKRHKKNFNYYLNEAAQILKSPQPLPDDFLETHTFNDKFVFFSDGNAKICRQQLQKLLTLLQRLAHQNELLTLVQILLASREKYTVHLSQYLTAQKIDNVSAISAIRHNEQHLFNCYAFLCYLDGVRFALENKFLNECPEPRHPALPTVSPLNELKMVAKIVTESCNIVARGKINQLYIQALTDYDRVRQRTEKYIKS